jgi:hypothetical protein
LKRAESPRIEVFTGFEATDNSESGYVGFGYAFGRGLYESGWRLRAVGSLGRYDYDGLLPDDGTPRSITFDGESISALRYSDTSCIPAPSSSKSSPVSRQKTKTFVRTILETRCKEVNSERGLSPRAGTSFHHAGCSPSMPPTEPPFRNIGALRALDTPSDRGSRSGWKEERSAMRSTTPGVREASAGSPYAIFS